MEKQLPLFVSQNPFPDPYESLPGLFIEELDLKGLNRFFDFGTDVECWFWLENYPSFNVVLS